MVDSKTARALAKRLEGRAERVVRRVQLTALQALTSATPVDTGHARSGWIPTVGSPADARLDRPKGIGTKEKPGKNRSRAESDAQKRLAASLAASREISKSYKLSQGQVYITNPVPYIVYLNEGSSAQAPAKFVEIAVAQAARKALSASSGA